MALKLKYKDEHGVVQINMSPLASPRADDIADPKFDTINNRFGQYDLFGGKYDSGGEQPSLFRSRYNSIEEELANTPYAFATERSLRLNTSENLDITIKSINSPTNDIEDDRFFRCNDYDLFGPQIDLKDEAFTVTQLIHAQDRYFDLSSRTSDSSKGVSAVSRDEGAFKVLPTRVKTSPAYTPVPVVSTAKRKTEKSFAILADPPAASRPSSPRSLPVEIKPGRVSPFRGRGFREETSRHSTPKTSATNSRASSPPRRRTNSLPRIDKMATVTLPPPTHITHSPRNFLKENIEEVRELSELNREKHEAEAEKMRQLEEEALLKEMGILDKKVRSRSTSRTNSPSRLKLRSRSNSPAAILHIQNVPSSNKTIVSVENVVPKPNTHRSRVRTVSKSQPQSNDGSPKNSKIPKRQSSVSPTRTTKRDMSNGRRFIGNGLNQNQRFISNSTSSIHETIRVGSQVHDKRGMSKSTQNLDISPAHIRGKPPISPGRGGPPPSNKTINAKRLSPIVGTPNKSPTEDPKPSSARTPTKPSTVPRKAIKTADNTPVSSRLNSRQPSRSVSRDPSPEKRTKTTVKPPPAKTVNRTSSNKTVSKTTVSKPEPKKPISRTSSIKSLTRTPSSKTLNEKPPLKKTNSKKDLTEKSQPNGKVNEVGIKKDSLKEKSKPQKSSSSEKDDSKLPETVTEAKNQTASTETETEEIKKQDNETQYDRITNDKGELVVMTKKNIVSMTTAAITSQPLEVVTKVTNQLPVVLEKAREKAMLERLSSKESLLGKEDEKDKEKIKDTKEKDKIEDNRPPKPARSHDRTIFVEDNVKLKPLQPPYNNPQVERVKQKIDDILKEPEISTENILTASAKSREAKSTFKTFATKTAADVKEAKDEVTNKLTNIKDQVVKQNDKMVTEIRSEATKIVDSIITPVEEPKEVPEKPKPEPKKEVEPVVMVVTEKKNIEKESAEKVNVAIVKGGADIEVQSSNVPAPDVGKIIIENNTTDESDKSTQSNGGYPGKSTLLRFPQSVSTTPIPPARTRRESKKQETNLEPAIPSDEHPKPPNLCERIMGKCKSKYCPCCVKGPKENDDKIQEESLTRENLEASKDNESVMKEDRQKEISETLHGKKMGLMEKLNCCKKKEKEEIMRDVETATGKASVEFEDEVKRKRKFRDIICCGRNQRVSDMSPRNIAMSTANVAMSPANAALTPAVADDTGCCGRRKSQVDRRDSILSDRTHTSCCNNRFGSWLRGVCRRQSEHSSSRRTSEFSKNKSLSPTLPPEDTRKKLDTSLVEHTSVMRGAIPILPIALAYFCLLFNIIVPGLGTICSGLFCLCFGIPRFGVHDGARHRIGSFVINLLVGCGQLFTVLFCLVGWGWSIWWGVIMLKISRKYRKLRAEAAAQEAEAPPITANNHTRP
ncbi:protein stum-like isoform X4 [Bombyx mandarina]|uniref:Protein stum-like isoform X4 n=1 Tax=Bombyx mandarina TaxID=7092 RepID=A0A6J2K759_BOMMA|nr:protein stum-like isoform X4 [Bombyx mandarina]